MIFLGQYFAKRKQLRPGPSSNYATIVTRVLVSCLQAAPQFVQNVLRGPVGVSSYTSQSTSYAIVL